MRHSSRCHPLLSFAHATVPKGLRQVGLHPVPSPPEFEGGSLSDEYLHGEGQGGRFGEG